MKTTALSKMLWCIFLEVGFCALPMDLTGVESESESACSPEVLVVYFPGIVVRETLNRFEVPEDKWNFIIEELNEKENQIIKIIENKASGIDPNPLKYPQQRQIVLKITRETLFEIFAEALKKHGFTDESKVQPMLDDIQKQIALRFAECMQKHTEHTSSE